MNLRFACISAVGLLMSFFLLVSCQDSEKVDTSNISVKVDIQRFDEAMMPLKTKEQIKSLNINLYRYI